MREIIIHKGWTDEILYDEIGIRIYVSICGGMEHFLFRLMYV